MLSRGVLPLAFSLFVGLALDASCSGSSAPTGDGIPEGGPGMLTPVCEPDTAAHCVGDGGCLGGHLCGPDGTYGECACIGDTGPTNFPESGPPQDGGRDAAEVGPGDGPDDVTEDDRRTHDSGGGDAPRGADSGSKKD